MSVTHPDTADANRQRVSTLALVAVAEFMVSLDVLVVTTAFGAIRHDLAARPVDLQWTLTVYTVCLAGCLMAGASLGDRFGRRRMLIIGIALFTIGSAGCGLSPGLGLLISSRALQGVGAALVLPLSLPLISVAFPPERQGRALGIVAGISGLATFAGPLIGGGLAAELGWRWIFWVNVPVGIVLMILIRRAVPESRGPTSKIDGAGMALVTAGLICLAWGLSRIPDRGLSSPDVLIGISIGLVLMISFVVWEASTTHPMIEIGLFGSIRFASTNLVTLCHSVLVLGAVALMAQYLQATLRIDSFIAGLELLPWTGSMMFIAPLAGRLADHIGTRTVIIGGLVLAGAGAGWLAWASHPGTSYRDLVPALVIMGIGNSAVFPAVSAAVVAGVDLEKIGPASGANNTVRQTGGVLGIAIMTAIFSATGDFTTSTAAAQGFRAALIACVVAALVGALAGVAGPSSNLWNSGE
ncbi:MFS transporter [Microlunatus endophyticus]|uniref:MFS transporter n=1 Tax=Microlunatus endophyticus TaxID=1716077 RepID=A0A917S6H8_9ACTN|nr:MFS transporter [Microlunatus endophyticus]GGL60550.1 MFS transporter [Microlunatus endophyticus]